MKVYSFKNLSYDRELLKLASSSKDKDSASEQYSKDQSNPKKDQKEESIEKIAEQLSAMNADENIKETGILASIEGSGPGLTVLFKNANGETIQKVSGSEFIKMREESKGSKRGSLLDKKL